MARRPSRTAVSGTRLDALTAASTGAVERFAERDVIRWPDGGARFYRELRIGEFKFQSAALSTWLVCPGRVRGAR
jgi:hypothetical protein